MNQKTKTSSFDPADHLRDEADCVAYLQAAIHDDGDISPEIAGSMLTDTLGAITRALIRIKAERDACQGK